MIDTAITKYVATSDSTCIFVSYTHSAGLPDYAIEREKRSMIGFLGEQIMKLVVAGGMYVIGNFSENQQIAGGKETHILTISIHAVHDENYRNAPENVQPDLLLKTEYQFLHFNKIISSGKPEYRCLTKTNIELGKVEWFPKWRQYIYTPTEQAVYSAGCLQDIANFIGQLK